MKDKISEYLDEVCLHIRQGSVHGPIRSELTSHITELVEGYADNGLSPDEAEAKALAQMGSAEEVGRRLDKQHRPKMEWSLIILTVALAALGLFINRSMTTPVQRITVAGLGLAAMLGTAFFDYSRLKKWSPWLFGLLCGGFVLTPMLSYAMGGRSVYRFMGRTMMAVFFTQLLFPLFAGLMVRVRTDGGFKDALKLTGLSAVVLAASMLLGRASYHMVYIIAFVIIFASAAFSGYFKKKRLALVPIGGIAVITALGGLAMGYYRLHERLMVVISGGSYDPMGAGYLTSNLMDVLRNSSMVGAMDGGLPAIMGDITELTLAGIIGGFGYLAGIAIIAVVALLLTRLFMTSSKIKGEYGRWLSLCCCALLLGKFAVNILMNFNLLPIMGVTLPLLGHGGTDYVITMFLVGLVLSVYRRNNLFPETKTEKIS